MNVCIAPANWAETVFNRTNLHYATSVGGRCK